MEEQGTGRGGGFKIKSSGFDQRDVGEIYGVYLDYQGGRGIALGERKMHALRRFK